MIFISFEHILEFLKNREKRKTIYTERVLAIGADSRVQVLTGTLMKQMGPGSVYRSSSGFSVIGTCRRVAGVGKRN
jgi:hypothetical protein